MNNIHRTVIKAIIIPIILVTVGYSIVNVSNFAAQYHAGWVVWLLGASVGASNAIAVYALVIADTKGVRRAALWGIFVFGTLSAILQVALYLQELAPLIVALALGCFGPVAEGLLSWLHAALSEAEAKQEAARLAAIEAKKQATREQEEARRKQEREEATQLAEQLAAREARAAAREAKKQASSAQLAASEQASGKQLAATDSQLAASSEQDQASSAQVAKQVATVLPTMQEVIKMPRKDIAKLAGVSRPSVDNWVNDGKLEEKLAEKLPQLAMVSTNGHNGNGAH